MKYELRKKSIESRKKMWRARVREREVEKKTIKPNTYFNKLYSVCCMNFACCFLFTIRWNGAASTAEITAEIIFYFNVFFILSRFFWFLLYCLYVHNNSPIHFYHICCVNISSCFSFFFLIFLAYVHPPLSAIFKIDDSVRGFVSLEFYKTVHLVHYMH